MNHLKEILKKKMLDQNLSMAALERKAGLNINSVRNIISGTIKNPSSKNLQAIASALGCSVDELLQKEESKAVELGSLHEDHPKKSENLDRIITDHLLLISTLKATLEIFKENNIDLLTDNVFKITKEGYFFSLIQK